MDYDHNELNMKLKKKTKLSGPRHFKRVVE